jgi:hypothetical protein
MASKTLAPTAIKLKVTSPENFITFIKRFSPISSMLLMEISDKGLSAKSYTPDRTNVKYSNISLDNVFEGKIPDGNVKIGILDIDKLAKVFTHFTETDEIFIDIDTTNYDGEIVGSQLVIYSKKLKIKIKCADLSIFKYISDETLNALVDSIEEDGEMEFSLTKDIFTEIKSLSPLAGECFTFTTNKGVITLAGDSFDLQIGAVKNVKDTKISIYTKRFGFIDAEDSNFVMGTNGMLLVRSSASNTIIVLGGVE